MRMWSRESGEVVRDIQAFFLFVRAQSLAQVLQVLQDPVHLAMSVQVAKEHKYVKALVISGDSVFTGDYCNLVQQWSLSTGQREAPNRSG